MQKKKLMLIFNPAAGKGEGLVNLGPILQVLSNGGYLPTVFCTTGAGDATRLVKEYCSEYDCVTCIGGDGTLSETVAGLAQIDDPPLLGYIPQGTANDVATTLNLSHIPVAAAKTIVSGSPVNLDVGRFNKNDYFTYIAAFGAFTDVSYETPRESKNTLGHFAYVLNAMGKLSRLTYHNVKVEYDNGKIEDQFVFGSVSNSTSVAGFVKLTDNGVELDDGLFEVILIKRPANVIEMNQIVSAVLARNYSGNKVIMLRSKNVKFSFHRPVKWTRDGEAGGTHKEVLCENIHSPIRIMT
ncbi:MAG: YegS/Rv2252/BmrU family lipid kinase [Clostridiales bacterium]|nr:YegS/Rv2252/BmrU family lipid kinase [Clostridiales bacterium]